MTKDSTTGVIALGLGLVVAVATTQIPESKMAGDVGARIFPYLISLLLVVCGGGLTVTGKKKTSKAYYSKDQLLRLGLITGSVLFYCLLLATVGFIISNLVGAFALCMMFGKSRQIAWWKAGVFSVVLTGSVYFVFAILFSIQLPTGMFF